MDESALAIGRVSQWLADAVPDVRPPLRFERIGRGRSNLTYGVEDAAGRRFVLRRPPVGPVLESAHDMRREHRVLAALAPSDVPAPTPLALCTDSAVNGAPFYAMQRIDGLTLDTDASASALSHLARGRVGASLAATLARIHEVDVAEVGLADLGRGAGYAERQLWRWRRQWQESRTRELAAIDRVAAALAASVPPQGETRLVHGDYSVSNVLVDADGAIVGVLDWELCTLGDPVADLATLLVYWPDAPEQALGERDPVSLLPGFGARADLVAVYAAAAPGRDLESLDFWLALSYWKLAVILEGVHRRWLEDPANGGPGAEGAHTSVDRLAALAEAALAGAAWA
jgi:aminoglycoside phosphotransferase (APT) family kinase protein